MKKYKYNKYIENQQKKKHKLYYTIFLTLKYEKNSKAFSGKIILNNTLNDLYIYLLALLVDWKCWCCRKILI